MTVRYTPEAIRDLAEIRDYIRHTLKNPQAAARITRGILGACGQLKQYPRMGPALEPRLSQPTELRYLIWETHIVFYRIGDNTVSVARILDGRQDYLRILFSDEE